MTYTLTCPRCGDALPIAGAEIEVLRADAERLAEALREIIDWRNHNAEVHLAVNDVDRLRADILLAALDADGLSVIETKRMADAERLAEALRHNHYVLHTVDACGPDCDVAEALRQHEEALR